MELPRTGIDGQITIVRQQHINVLQRYLQEPVQLMIIYINKTSNGKNGCIVSQLKQ